jgi:hypothetical protein
MKGLPSFVKPLGLDLIIRPGGEVVLIELQHHFGRSGMLHLYPSAAARYRKEVRRLRQDIGTAPEINFRLQKICASKIVTYRALARHQPASLVYQWWKPSVKKWLDGLTSEFILSKPPRGSCGRGILLFRRRHFGPDSLPRFLSGPLLLQEYTESKKIADDLGRPHMGCIRHIVVLVSDGKSLGFMHLPSYWRVSPSPFLDHPERSAFTANISTGAYAAPVDGADRAAVTAAAEQIASELIGEITGQEPPPPGPSATVSPEGSFPDLWPDRSVGTPPSRS